MHTFCFTLFSCTRLLCVHFHRGLKIIRMGMFLFKGEQVLIYIFITWNPYCMLQEAAYPLSMLSKWDEITNALNGKKHKLAKYTHTQNGGNVFQMLQFIFLVHSVSPKVPVCFDFTSMEWCESLSSAESLYTENRISCGHIIVWCYTEAQPESFDCAAINSANHLER